MTESPGMFAERAGGGSVPVVLEATPLGLSLYRRMGFETVTRFLIFVSD